MSPFSITLFNNCILLDDWQVAKKFLLELHGIKDSEISKITEISDFSCVIKPCRGSASFGVSRARSLLEAEGIFHDLLGLLKCYFGINLIQKMLILLEIKKLLSIFFFFLNFSLRILFYFIYIRRHIDTSIIGMYT